jgi:hypothetical protein
MWNRKTGDAFTKERGWSMVLPSIAHLMWE